MSKNKTFTIVGKKPMTTYRIFSFVGFMYLLINLIMLPMTLFFLSAMQDEENSKKK